jgi:hypothetical protein
MITPAFGLTATERVLPRLALDFTTASLDSRITFTRSLGTATRVNSSGLIESVAADTPRFDFNPITLVCKGLLIEESRTNLLRQSSAFGTTWAPTRSSISSNVVGVIAPDGTETADKLIDTSVNNSHYVGQSFTAVTGAHTATVFAMAAEITQIQIVAAQGTTFRGRGYNLLTGQIFNESFGGVINADLTCDMEDFGNGWWRCRMSWTADGQTEVWVALSKNGAATYLGNDTDGAYIWGAQLEAGAFATSYIPTEASQVTRSADVASMTGTNFSDWYNATEGTFQMLFTGSPRTASAANADMFLRTGDIQLLRGGGSLAYGALVGSGTFQSSGVTTANLACRVGLAYKATQNAFVLNNGTFRTDAGSAYGTPTSLYIGSNLGLNGWVNSHIQKVNYWPQRLIDNEVKTISK